MLGMHLEGIALMKIYTKSGDDGKTGLFQGPRVSKDDARIEAYGTVDELSAVLGVARAAGVPEDVEPALERIQHQLFSLGAELATPDPSQHGTALIGPADTDWIEETIDQFDGTLAPLKTFILPGGTPAAAALHHARVVCRRAERRVVTLSRSTELSTEALTYLNRVGDLLFVLARYANSAAGKPDVAWERAAD
jgi:cob(I)alamin adenosyltransferase